MNMHIALLKGNTKAFLVALVGVSIVAVWSSSLSATTLPLLSNVEYLAFSVVVGGLLLFFNVAAHIWAFAQLPQSLWERRKVKNIVLLEKNFAFPVNQRFDELWSEQKERLDWRGARLRIFQREEWRYSVGEFRFCVFVIEGAITCIESEGDISLERFERLFSTIESIQQEMGWTESFTIINILRSGKADKDVARKMLKILTEKWERGARENAYFIASDFIRMSFSIARKALPHPPASTWRVFSSFDDALNAMLARYFSRQENSDISRYQSAAAVSAEILRENIHKERIEQIRTFLARVASSDVGDISIPSISPEDIYAGIFKELEMVLEDKRAQIQKIHDQAQELERQAAEILQLANNKFEEQNREIEKQSIEIQLANVQLSEQNMELSAINRGNNELVEIVAHDLKNPIGLIRGFADLIKHGFVEGVQAREAASKTIETADRMLDLVKNLLEVHRLEQGAAQFNIASFSIVPIVESVVWSYQSSAEVKKITLRYCAESGVQTEAKADEEALLQVIDNLVSNAVKYSPHGKNIVVRVKSSYNAVRLEVQDEGPGISEEDMKKLFGKFARLSARPTGGEHSTGLGLSIVKKAVEAMNGKVWCESELGKGATFILELPAASLSSDRRQFV